MPLKNSKSITKNVQFKKNPQNDSNKKKKMRKLTKFIKKLNADNDENKCPICISIIIYT